MNAGAASPQPRLGVVLGIGAGEALFLLVIGLIVMGPEKLPRVAADIVRTVRALRRMATEAREEVRSALGPQLWAAGLDDEDDVRREPARLAPGAVPPYDRDAT